MPYHALSYAERETYNARRRLLGHMGDVVRQKCIERERKRMEDEIAAGLQCEYPIRVWRVSYCQGIVSGYHLGSLKLQKIFIYMYFQKIFSTVFCMANMFSKCSYTYVLNKSIWKRWLAMQKINFKKFIARNLPSHRKRPYKLPLETVIPAPTPAAVYLGRLGWGSRLWAVFGFKNQIIAKKSQPLNGM